jgi:hypothetical protein
MQRLDVAGTINGQVLYLASSNMLDGQLVSLLLHNTSQNNSILVEFLSPAGSGQSSSGFRLVSAPNSASLTAGKSFVVSWQVFGTNIFCTEGSAF